ncbi:hypothetical protein [Acidihalobacter aeolianus]|nr:hypothetical protein [Acidihalobacter aeolianus]
MDVDKAKEVFDSLIGEWSANEGAISTEQDTRFQIIDRMLTDVLGWSREKINTEPHVESGYVDYLVNASGKPKLVVEAKRAETPLLNTKQENYRSYKLGGPALQSAVDGVKQAQRYCLDVAVPFAVLTTGFQWIGFWALRTDGVRPKDGQAFAFPTLQSISKNFSEFYDLFSREGVLNGLFRAYIQQAEGLSITQSDPLYRVLENKDIRLLSKSRMAADLDTVFRSFFGTMSGDNDPEMLAKCFVESKESREADISLQKIARNLISRIDVVESAEAKELQEHVRTAVDSQKGEFVLVIGNKGAGKSTFIDRFFRMVLDKRLRDQCIVIRIDVADSDGVLDGIADWLVSRMIHEVEQSLFQGRSPRYEELQGIFFSDYDRWRNGEHKPLYERDKAKFKEKFGDHIASLVASKPRVYLARILQDAVRSRKLMPCLIFDNTDHFPQPFQEAVFQFAQSIHREVLSFVVCPITDRTIWQLSKHGPMQSYETTSFYLPVPSTKEVLKKRVDFLKDKLEAEEKERKDYFLTKGIRLRLEDLHAFAVCIDELFVQSEYVSRTIGWLSNHDIRRGLNMAQRVITSPIVSMEELVKTYLSNGRLTIPRLKIRQALIFGEHSQYQEDANDYIVNVFSIYPESVTTPLLRLSVLRMLFDIHNQASDAENTYISVESIQDYFETCGIPRIATAKHLSKLLSYRLVESYDPTDQEIYESQRLRITHSGQIHQEFSLRDHVYMSSMAMTTGVRSVQCIEEIREINSRKMTKEDWKSVEKKFASYLLREDMALATIPNLENYAGQHALRSELGGAWGASS